MARPLSLAYITMSGKPADVFAQAAAAAGFDSIGGMARPGRATDQPELMSLTEARAYRRLVANLGISILDIGGFVLAADTDVRAALPLVEVGAELGGEFLIVPAYDPDGQRACDNFQALCDLAAPHGIKPLLEFGAHMGITSVAQACTLLDRASRSNAGVALDTLLWFRAGGRASDTAALDFDAPMLIQLCDGPALAPAKEHLRTESLTARRYPGEGELDLAGLLAALPTGAPISVEVPNSASEAQDARSIAERAFKSATRVVQAAMALG